MADDYITREALANGAEDLRTIDRVVNGAADYNGDGLVISRTGDSIRTIRKVEADMVAAVGFARQFVSVTAGLAGTENGEIFETRTSSGGRTGNFTERYRNDNGVATFLDASNRAEIYGSIDNGLANTKDTEVFEVTARVAGEGEIYSRIYRNVGGSAQLLYSVPLTPIFGTLSAAQNNTVDGQIFEVRGSNGGRTGNFMERYRNDNGTLTFVGGVPDKFVFRDLTTAMAETYPNSIFYVVSTVGGRMTIRQYQKSAGGAEYTLLGTLDGGSGGTPAVLPHGIYSSKTLLSLGVTEGFRNMTGNDSQQAGVDPGIIPSALQSVSGYIDVKKGECYSLTFPQDTSLTTQQNFVQFFEGTTPIGSLVWAIPKGTNAGGDLAKVLGVEGDPKRQLTRYFRVPRDGRIRVSGTTANIANIALSQVSYEEFVDRHLWRLAAFNLKEPHWQDRIYSPIYNRTYVQYNNDGTTTTQANGAISEKIPVTAGQFVTAIVPTDNTGASVIFTNASGQFVSSVGTYNNVSSSWTATGQTGGLLANENIPVPATATNVEISIRGHDYPYTDAGLIIVTDEFEQWERDWVEPGKELKRWSGYRVGNRSPGMVEANSNYDCFPQINMKPGTILKVTYQLAALGDKDLPISRVYGQAANLLAAGQSARLLLTTGLAPQATPELDVTYTAYYYAENVPAVLFLSTKAGFGSAEALTPEQFVEDRNAVIANLPIREKVTGGSGSPYGIYSSGYTAGIGSVGYIPLLPYEAVNFKTNYTEVFGFTGEFRPVYGNFDARFLRIPRLFLGNVTAPNDFKRTIQNNDSFTWLYFQVASTDPNYFVGDAIEVMSKEEFESQYLDTGKEIDNGYMRDIVARLDWDDGELIQNIWDTGTFSNDNIRAMAPFSVIKGQYYRWKMSMGNMKQLRGPTVVYLNPAITGASGYYTPKPVIEMGPTVLPNQISAQPMMGYFQAEEDGWLYLTERRCGANEDPDSATGRLYDAFKQLSVELVSEETYINETQPTSDSRMLIISDPVGLEFHAINGPMPYHRSELLDQEYRYPVQIWQKGVRLGVWELRTSVQGSGSTSVDNIKVNIDVKLYNAKGKKIDIKIGDWQQTDKLTLKANNYDRTANRDAIATRIWREMRRERPFPDDRILDPQIWDKEPTFKDVRFFENSVGSTQGVPAAAYYGGQYYGLFMLRNKKDEPNYGIVKEEPDFIWLQSDYRWNFEANGEVNFVKWGAWDWKQWEVTQPEEPSYTVGSVPTTQTTVDAVSRLFDWIEGCISDGAPTRFATEAPDYLYVDSWVDYYIQLELLNAQDNNDNNIILSTYNGTSATQRWTIHAYDFDSTMGWLGNPVTGHIPDNADVFRLIRQGMFDVLSARYAELRQNVLSVKNLMHIVREEGGKAPLRWREDDEDLWGSQDYNSVVGIQKWLSARLDYLDDYFGV